MFCVIGAFSLNNTTFDVYLTLLFGMLGYVMRKLDIELAPLVLAFVLGPLFEDSLRQSLVISRGDLMIFFYRPLSLIFLLFGIGLFILPLIVPFAKLLKGGRGLERN